MEPLLTPDETSKVLKIKKRAVYRLIKQGKLTALRVGRQLRVLESDLNRFLEEQRERGTR